MKGLKEIIKLSTNLIHGIAAAPGLVVGKAYLYSKANIFIDENHIDDVETAIENLHQALDKSKKELLKIFDFAKEKMGGTRAAIFEAQLMILDDPVLILNIENRIRKEKKSSEYIVNDEISKYQQLMVLSKEPYMKERAHDIDDIKNRIIRNLQKKKWESKIIEDKIVVSEFLTPADTILFTKRNVKAYVTDRGGLTSHAAIIARSLDLPAVVGTHNATELIKNDDLLIVDGFHGIVFINPNEHQLNFFNEKINHLNEINVSLKELRNRPATTQDGREINLYANVDVSGEIDLVITNGAKGIGLYRTEQIIEELGEFPNEEEQVKIYTNLATRIYPYPVTIRAFDIGGDKVKQLDLNEANPFLGLRGIRFLLENQTLFRTQIRAVLRASEHKNVRFMLPMISTIQEIHKSKTIVDECKQELSYQGCTFDKNIKVGIMIEVPSAAIMTTEYSKEIDFISIGTNDLIQYTMAVDRGNDYVSNLYQEFHPSVLRLVNHIIKEGKNASVHVNICGEMAADTLAVPVLVGMGLDSLSVSPSALPSIKRTIRSFTFEDAQKLVNEILKMKTENEIMFHIEKFFNDHSIQRTRNIL